MCTPFLREQTRTIDPLFIVTLGNFATKFILKTDRGITGLHGKLYQTGKFKVFPVFHPAAAIYDRRKRTDLEDDFATLGEYLLQEGIVARTPQSVVREAEAHARAQAAGAAVPGASAAPGASGGLEAAGLGDAPVDSAPGAVESAAPESSTSHAGRTREPAALARSRPGGARPTGRPRFAMRPRCRCCCGITKAHRFRRALSWRSDPKGGIMTTATDRPRFRERRLRAHRRAVRVEPGRVGGFSPARLWRGRAHVQLAG